MPKKLDISSIVQDYSIRTRPESNRYTIQDREGLKWRRWADAGIGLTRIVHALDGAGRTVKTKERSSHTELRTIPHSRMNEWMDRQTDRLRARSTNSNVKVIGHFASRTELQEQGLKVLTFTGQKPIEWVPLYIAAAQKLTKAGVGGYTVKIDTDDYHLRPDRAMLVGYGTGHPETGLWSDYYNVVGSGFKRFDELRERGMDLNPAFRAANVAMQQSVTVLQQNTLARS